MMEVDFTTWELSPLPGRKDPAYHAVASMGQFGRRNIGKITSLSDGEEFQTMRGGGGGYIKTGDVHPKREEEVGTLEERDNFPQCPSIHNQTQTLYIHI